MKHPLIHRAAPLLFAALLALGGCADSPEPSDAPPVGERPEVSPCHQAFTPEAVSFEADTTDYRAIAEAVFEGVSPASDSDFTYEPVEGGVRLTAYHGAGGKVVIPDSIRGNAVVALGDGLFADNTDLTALSVPTGVTSIGTGLLTGCRSLQVLRLPQLGAQRDGQGFLSYFFGCDTPVGSGFRVPSSLDTVILWNTVTAIPDNAFLECDKLRMVLLPDTLTSIGRYAFSNCSQLHFIPLPSSLQTLGERAFESCYGLRAVTLPDALQSVGLGAYAGCTRLEQLTLPFLGESRDGEGSIGHLFGAESYMWNATHLPGSLRSVTLTSGNVDDHAFYGCDSLALVTLPEGCTSVGIRAFYACTNLQSITLPSGTRTIGELAFYGCHTLDTVTLPESLQSIGMQALGDCFNLTEITLPARVGELAPSTFAGCCNLQTVTLGDSLATVGAQAFRGCVSLHQVTGGAPGMAVKGGNDYLHYCLNESSNGTP